MEAECCPRFDPKPWDGKISEWKGKRFIKGSVLTAFYMPLNFGGVIGGLMKKAEAAGASVPDWLCLSDHTSMWNMDLYVAVDREVEGALNVAKSGRFISKVYEGPYKDTGKWRKDFEEYLSRKKLKGGRMYMWYTTCPGCAKKYGKNYVVMVSELG